ncbi:hypothetical protein [Geodermatophilus sp. URMC 62]
MPALEARTGLRFPAAVRDSDRRNGLADAGRRAPLTDAGDVRW